MHSRTFWGKLLVNILPSGTMGDIHRSIKYLDDLKWPTTTRVVHCVVPLTTLRLLVLVLVI